MKVIQLEALTDNYIYVIICEKSHQCAVIDPAEAPPVLKTLQENSLTLSAILITHHHADHTGGNRSILKKFNVPVYGSAYDKEHSRIDGQTHALKDGDLVTVGKLNFDVLSVPGHTLGHLAYVTKDAVFCGDTLFASGCGKLFEGTPEIMLESLKKLKMLPDTTRIYCAHEYTQHNLEFALTLEPMNIALNKKHEAVCKMRKSKLPTVPTTLAEEKAYNPFLRWDSPELIRSVKQKVPGAQEIDLDIFAATRGLKDRF